jgi:YegS/Rv2252/BmrU family lipid kinase
MARDAANAGVSLAVCVGGDGTFHETANGILGSDTTIGLIPFGTGNDLARALGLFGSVQRACDAIKSGVVRKIDVGVVRGTGFEGPRHFFVICGTGFDAKTAQTVNSGIRFISGAPAYIWGSLVTLAKFEPFELTVTTETETRNLQAMFVSVANAATTGGGMLIAPGAVVDDGFLDLCVVGKVSKATLAYQLTQVFSGAHTRHPAVSMIRGKEITLDALPAQPLLIDGEVIGTTPASISVIPQALSILVPTSN